MVAWAKHVFIARLVTNFELFKRLPDDCAGDILEFFEMAMTSTDALHLAKQCSSPEAFDWVRAVVAAAVAVSATKGFFKCQKYELSRASLTLYTFDFVLLSGSLPGHSGEGNG